MIHSLSSVSDVFREADLKRRIAQEEQLDQILENGDDNDLIEGLIDKEQEEQDHNEQNEHNEHTYQVNTTIDDHAFQMFCGYVARKARTFSCAKKCENCFRTLTKPSDQPLQETQHLIEKRSRGFLLVASDALYGTLKKVEDTNLKVISRSKLHHHILFEGKFISKHVNKIV